MISVKKKIVISLLFLVLVGTAGYFLFYLPNRPATEPLVTNKEVKEAGTFDECVKEGNPIEESYPPVCRTKSGKILTQNIGNEMLLKDQIKITSPRPNEIVKSPLKITGLAKGGWFFEGQFSSKLLNQKGEVVGEGVLKAEGEWMTEEFVDFSGEIIFDKIDDSTGKLILEKANPSGIVKSDSQLIVPIKFK